MKPYIDWPPSLPEIDAIMTGEPLLVQVYTPVGEIFQYPIDESTTVEGLMTEWVWKEKYFQKEPDREFYWLFKHVEKSDNFDVCLSKDKKILKLLSQSEKEGGKPPEGESNNGQGKRFSFMQKKTSKFLRKATIAA